MPKSHTTRIMTGGGADTFGTPPFIYAWADDLFHFTLDVAADDANHLCPRYFTEQNSAFDQPWVNADGSPAVVWCNPPYGRGKQEPFFRKAYEEMMERGTVSVLLVPVRPDTPRWYLYASKASDVWFLTSRVKFIDPATKMPTATGHPMPSCFIVFDREAKGDREYPLWDWVSIGESAEEQAA